MHAEFQLPRLCIFICCISMVEERKRKRTMLISSVAKPIRVVVVVVVIIGVVFVQTKSKESRLSSCNNISMLECSSWILETATNINKLWTLPSLCLLGATPSE